ncbi:Thioredoxin [Rhynchospora pubera]|uniref:Thioredoxin n=1 Tax=Rhynchospora pubera TaxID=906938 RepID=A0AAV8CNZ4_9POAL|nr:Thioredoxin [Rhynchospora pubera]KAJ4810046.1 Thioredoxin [Rhynchospora pubera]
MALRISLSTPPSLHSTPSQWSSSSSSSLVPNRCIDWSGTKRRVPSAISMDRKRESVGVVRSSLEATQEAAGAVALEGQVTEVTKDTFWPIVKAAGDKVVVLDMYTQWCGPCKIIAPRYQELSEKNLDVVFLKLDCNQDNKPLAKELGIRVVPTFKILKEGKIVKEVTGAKIDDLVYAIETVKSS